jgi:predicted nuclease of predicted toxin-antitoxin system
MTFFFDNNLSPKLPHILRLVNRDACHLRSYFPRDVEDSQYLPEVGQRGWVVVTRDEGMLTRPAERLARRQHRITCVYLKGYPRTPDHLQQALWVLRRWPDVELAVREARRGTWLEVPVRGQIRRSAA